MSQDEEREVQQLLAEIARLEAENAALTYEINVGLTNMDIARSNVMTLQDRIEPSFKDASEEVDLNADKVHQLNAALEELSSRYFVFKALSTASKNLTQANDEYYTRFSFYNKLRRITLGFIIGLESHFASDEKLRKTVEKAYLQNTDYWLAYATSAVMLWASDEESAAKRALDKALLMNRPKASMFFLLTNLRFGRIEPAKKWFLEYMRQVDAGHLGDEFQYLLQAYLCGLFGHDPGFQETVESNLKALFARAEVSNVGFSRKVADRADSFAAHFLHTTDQSFFYLKEHCESYADMLDILSCAERNSLIAAYYDRLLDTEHEEDEDLPQRIENVLYALINDYDDAEQAVVDKIKYNEAVVAAKGDVAMAQQHFDEQYVQPRQKRSFADMLIEWAFVDEDSLTPGCVRCFSVSFLVEWIEKGFARYAERYRTRESENYAFNVDGCKVICGENDVAKARDSVSQYYRQHRFSNTVLDKYSLIYILMCVVGIAILGIMLFTSFSPAALTIGILLVLAGVFLLWRRIVDLKQLLKERERVSIQTIEHCLEELGQWRSTYHEEDARYDDLVRALKRFEEERVNA